MMDDNNKLLKIILIVVLVNTVLLLVCLFGETSSTDSTIDEGTITDENTQTAEYDTSKVEEIDYAKFEELFKGQTNSLVLFARPTCGYCVQFMPVLNEVIEENGLKVYYLDITNMTEENETAIRALDPFFEENYGYTPALAYVGNGKVAANNVGYIEKDGLESFLTSNGILS